VTYFAVPLHTKGAAAGVLFSGTPHVPDFFFDAGSFASFVSVDWKCHDENKYLKINADRSADNFNLDWYDCLSELRIGCR
jgi:hypothetical protein